MAVTAKSARGAARKPGGAVRRHAQAVPDFQTGNADMPLMKWARPTLRGMHAASRKLLVIPAHRGRFGLQVHAGLVLPGGKPGHVNAAA